MADRDRYHLNHGGVLTIVDALTDRDVWRMGVAEQTERIWLMPHPDGGVVLLFQCGETIQSVRLDPSEADFYCGMLWGSSDRWRR